ncbi:Rrp15p-domain-containing protein [Boletus reticuloceps]|uniref:Rrp15p-domain-containing protein n=1 Tax=Boletus reticuloceps TaxID=495285 RepID=A0A8I2Z1L9_9AGAM|nr:Rrp15p-domain-containing protein [Boletus reticuloceps]
MSTNKRVKLAEGGKDDSNDDSQLSGSSDGEDAGHSSQEGSQNIEDKTEGQRMKSKKTLKRKRRATEPLHFGETLQSLLNTDAPSGLLLSLKPSVARQKNDAKLELEAKKVIHIERKEREERGRIRDVIGGWGGESERSLRKVAQRGVVKLFNTIQQSQLAAAAAEKRPGPPVVPENLHYLLLHLTKKTKERKTTIILGTVWQTRIFSLT